MILVKNNLASLTQDMVVAIKGLRYVNNTGPDLTSDLIIKKEVIAIHTQNLTLVF